MNTIDLYKKTINSGKFITLMDQVCVTASNFLLSLLITKNCGLSSYGAFASAWLWVLFLSSLQQAYILMPMFTLFYKTSSNDYLNRLAKFQFIISLIAVVLICLGQVVFTYVVSGQVRFSLTTCLLALIAALFMWNELMRKRFFLLGEAKKALFLDCVVYVCPILLIYFLSGVFSDLHAILYCLLCFFTFGFLINSNILLQKTTKKSLLLIAKRHWKSGYYLILTAVLQWFAGNSFLVIGSSILTTKEFGAIRIAQNIIGIATVYFQYLENTVPIELGDFIKTKGYKNLGLFCFKLALKSSPIIVGFLVLVFVFKKELIVRFYGIDNASYTWIISCLCLLQVFVFIGSFIRFYLRSIENNQVVFYGYLLATIISFLIASNLINNYGQLGVIFGLFLHQLVIFIPFLFINKLKTHGKV